MPQELLPRDGAHIPRREQVSPDEQAAIREIERLAGSEAQAMTVLAQSALRSADATEDGADLLEDIRDILIKVCQNFSIPLPKRIADALESGDLNPDKEEDDDGDDEDKPGNPEVT